MSLWRRLSRLEHKQTQQVLARNAICPTCGRGPGVTPVYRVTFAGDADAGKPKHCPSCGRQQVFVIEFDEKG